MFLTFLYFFFFEKKRFKIDFTLDDYNVIVAQLNFGRVLEKEFVISLCSVVEYFIFLKAIACYETSLLSDHICEPIVDVLHAFGVWHTPSLTLDI